MSGNKHFFVNSFYRTFLVFLATTLFLVGAENSAAASQAVINSFSPASAPVGAVVTLTGVGFTGATQAWLGSQHGIAVTVTGDTKLSFKIPTGAVSGQMAILTPTSAAFSSSNLNIIVVAPVTTNSQQSIISFSPQSGPIGTVVKLSGSGFTGTNQAWLGSVHGLAVSVTDDKDLSFVVPTGASTGQIAILNPTRAAFSSSTFTVVASNVKPVPSNTPTPPTATPSPTPVATPVSTPSPVLSNVGSFGARVSGSHLVDSTGKTLQLRGANMSGLEFVGVQGQDVASWGGTIPNWSTYKTWKPNVVRIPLNVASWLGLTTYNANVQGATSFSTAVKADPQGNYRQTVINAIAGAQSTGAYVILDLHWSAPQVTLNGVTQYITPNGQPEFMNATTDLDFWKSIAETFGTQATPQAGVNNTGIIFELFNEPYIDYYHGGAELFSLMKNGGTVTTFHWAIGAYSVSPTGGVAMAGYQQALDAIRATGANNILIVNGPSWAQSGQNFSQYVPTDTLVPAQVAAAWHPYPHGQYPYTNGDVYGLTGSDTGAGTSTFDQWFKAILSGGVPVIITEDGGRGGINATSGEPHMAFMEKWADTNGASYVAWEWSEPQVATTTQTDNFLTMVESNGVIAPILGAGVQFYNWMLAH